MTKPATPMKKQQRAHYTDACREEALLSAERLGVTTAACDLGLHSLVTSINGTPKPISARNTTRLLLTRMHV